jgi:hypothetical protein
VLRFELIKISIKLMYFGRWQSLCAACIAPYKLCQ